MLKLLKASFSAPHQNNNAIDTKTFTRFAPRDAQLRSGGASERLTRFETVKHTPKPTQPEPVVYQENQTLRVQTYREAPENRPALTPKQIETSMEDNIPLWVFRKALAARYEDSGPSGKQLSLT